jgi:predicted naringenin-chalcone synthase
MSLRVEGVGTAVPCGYVTQEDAARLAVEGCDRGYHCAATVSSIYQGTQVRKRHSVLITSSSNGEPATQNFFPTAVSVEDRGPSTAARMRRYEADALDLAADAASQALDDAAVERDAISHLVTVSCSGFSAPGVDVGLIERLDLRRDVARTHVGFMGCHGALNGLRVADALANKSPANKVLLCCVEICSIHHQYTDDLPQIVANALFSDGAAAVIGSKADSPRDGWQLVDQQSYILPDTADHMAWRIGDHGFQMTLSVQVPSVIRGAVRPWITRWLEKHDLTLGDIRGWAVHPGGPLILSSCAEALGLGADQLQESHQILAEYGNMSSPTVLFILERLRQQPAGRPCVMLAFGPGLTIEAALFR